ncbi:hypothetical protein D9619_004174 [Psilocybe cf. subviscida]|uniref:Uncharacterized protein n=1 Tax=Psilocybe cf. subviscida TaxID=2480587 RepID=A0A8H5BSI3_9AGAR|nr:hypothetical protein D9619_004174 [Psilocybe cf. subviscida]
MNIGHTAVGGNLRSELQIQLENHKNEMHALRKEMEDAIRKQDEDTKRELEMAEHELEMAKHRLEEQTAILSRGLPSN